MNLVHASMSLTGFKPSIRIFETLYHTVPLPYNCSAYNIPFRFHRCNKHLVSNTTVIIIIIIIIIIIFIAWSYFYTFSVVSTSISLYGVCISLRDVCCLLLLHEVGILCPVGVACLSASMPDMINESRLWNIEKAGLIMWHVDICLYAQHFISLVMYLGLFVAQQSMK
jgi:hypothetical protein